MREPGSLYGRVELGAAVVVLVDPEADIPDTGSTQTRCAISSARRWDRDAYGHRVPAEATDAGHSGRLRSTLACADMRPAAGSLYIYMI